MFCRQAFYVVTLRLHFLKSKPGTVMLRWITPGGAIRTRWLSSNSLQVESRRERFVHSTPNKCPLRGLLVRS